MATFYVFADEAGDFVFKRKKGASTYFILCTVSAPVWTVSDRLLHVRRRLSLEGDPERDKLHATSDLQEVHNEVFAIIAEEDFRIDATILEKSKAQPQTRVSQHRFYQYAWYYHFRHVGPILARKCDKMLVTAAALGERKTKAAFKAAVNDTMQQTLARDRWEVAFHESAKDPLLWLADYCAWAIQKKWESGGEERRSYDLIRRKIATEFDLWERGGEHFY
jgi:hypothetical protein